MPGTHYTTDGEPPDPGRWDAPAPKPIDPKTGQHGAYYVLPPVERVQEFLRPYRTTYKHLMCGATTSMSRPLAETFARDPGYYSGGTFCYACCKHFPLKEFVWDGTDETVGS